jgi:hypothetical protein
MRDKLIALLGTWGSAPDLPAKIALGLAILLSLCAALGRGRSLLGFDMSIVDPDHDGDDDHDPRASARRFVVGASFAAALLSIAYISSYLHGGPRIIDATTYFLQGRALSHGHLAWTPLDPSASFRGRFLIYGESPGSALCSGRP